MPKKLARYEDLETYANVINCEVAAAEPLTLTSTWDNSNFSVDQDITLELGCGRGEYTFNLARKYRDRNFIGIDIKGARLWHGARCALQSNLENVLYIKMQAEHLDIFFPGGTISKIWLPFPDPHLNRSGKKAGKRLTSPRFLNIYKYILKENGTIHVKTDNQFLYEYSIESAQHIGASITTSIENLHGTLIDDEATLIQTKYEKRYLKESLSIKYLVISF